MMSKRYFAKPQTWFDKGTEVFMIGEITDGCFDQDCKFPSQSALFRGKRNGKDDEESCGLYEFDIKEDEEKNDGWYGVDLDGTLAVYDGWKGHEHIGEPILLMVNRVKEWLADGKDVRIFTARLCEGPRCIPYINEWCTKHIGQALTVTNVKTFDLIELWDDRAVQMIPNTGMIQGDYANESGQEYGYERGYDVGYIAGRADCRESII